LVTHFRDAPKAHRKRTSTAIGLHDADLYVNAKYFGVVFASAARLAATQRPFAARCLTDKAPAAIGWKTIPSWYVIGDADIPPDILNNSPRARRRKPTTFRGAIIRA
jgi:hypothetical protein